MSEERTLEQLGLSTFDFRKAQYLLGKTAKQNYVGTSGPLLAAGEVFTIDHVDQLNKSGQLNKVFLETTQK